MSRRPRVYYLVYWGALEPLGRSLVVPSVTRLASAADLTLITFEKPSDLARAAEVEETESVLARSGVTWVALRYRQGPTVLSKLRDALQAGRRVVRTSRGGRPDIIHARTFVGGVMGLMARAVVGGRLIYHNEGFYPDEQVDGGVWRSGSSIHRFAKTVERLLYARADGIITLSDRARSVVEALPSVAKRRTPVVVAPSAVDLTAFVCRDRLRWPETPKLRFVYAGSAGKRYLLDAAARFVGVVGRLTAVHLRVLSQSDAGVAGGLVRQAGLPPEQWSLDRVAHSRMPAELLECDVGLSFMTQGISEHGGSPTKIGEFWACGLPVVTTPNVGDIDEIIRRRRVGVVVRNHSETACQEAAREMLALLQDPALPGRCRAAAEAHYSVGSACQQQIALYQRLLVDQNQ